MGLKDEGWRRDIAAYPVRFTLPTRYGDMDANAHLNNVAIARLIEESRVRFHYDVKAMGADVIIAVDVSTPLDDIDDVQSVLGITNQSLTVMILNNTKRVIALADVVVVPDLGDYGAGSFSASGKPTSTQSNNSPA